MKLSASLSRRARFAAWCSGAAVLVLGVGSSHAGEPTAPASGASSSDEAPLEAKRVASPFAGRFPNVVLKTHEGRNVRFYDDLLKGKIVLINFMYATCTER